MPSKNFATLAKKPSLSGLALALPALSALELLEQLALAPGQVPRRLDGDLDIHVAALGAAQHGEAFGAQAELVARLRAGGNLHLGPAAVDRGHLDFAAERRPRQRQRHAAVDVGAVALENFMRADADMDVEIARRCALRPGLALAGQPDAGAVLDAGRNRHLQRPLALHGAAAVADLAGVLDHPAGAAAGRAGPLDQEETLLRPHLALAAARRAGRVVADLVLRAGAVAHLALHPGRDPELHLGAAERVGEVDLHLGAQVRAAAGAAAAAAAGHLAEQPLEDVAEPALEVEAAREARPGPAPCSNAAWPKRS